MPSDPLILTCPAKVNLSLAVGSSDPSIGLHPICSWMVAVDFGDTLTLWRGTGGQSTFDIRVADDAPTEQVIDWPLEKDLAFRAHGLVESHIGRALPVAVRLEKRIPSGAGLGGGSSDAAGMLVGLNRLFDLGLTDQTLFDLGLRRGSDVGFLVKAMLGIHSALVEGHGERISAAPLRQAIHFVLVLPAIQCATAEVYQRFDALNPSATLDASRVRSLMRQVPLQVGELFNDLAEAASKVQPGLSVLRERVKEVTGLPVHVSGSGAAMFMAAQSLADAKRLCAAVHQEVGVSAVVARVDG